MNVINDQVPFLLLLLLTFQKVELLRFLIFFLQKNTKTA